MSHIHTGPGEHDQTSSAFIIRVDTPQPQLLLHSHKIIRRLLQIGGHVELTENPWEAILREIPEETGYDLAQLLILQPRDRLLHLSRAKLHPVAVCQLTHSFNGNPNHKHTDTEYAFLANGLPAGQPRDGESIIFRWVTLAELEALPDEQIPINVREVGCFVLTACVQEWERVELSVYPA